MKDKLKILVACKKNNHYDENYIKHIYSMVSSFVDCEYDFIAYTDFDFEFEDIIVKRFEYNFPAWWCKLELFKEKGVCLYLDLDTSLFSGMEIFLENLQFDTNSFYMLEELGSRLAKIPSKNKASGVMAWNGDFSFILDELLLLGEKEFYKGSKLNWDQNFINKVASKKIEIKKLQDYLTIYSYKYHIQRDKRNPFTSDIVCFHGKPKPKDVKGVYWGGE